LEWPEGAGIGPIQAGQYRGMADARLPPMGYYARVTLTVAGILVVLAAAWKVRAVLLLVLVAAVLAVGLDPAVRRLQRLHLSRGMAVTLIFLGAIAFVALFAFLVIPPVVDGVRSLASDIPGYIERLTTKSEWFRDLDRKYDLSEKLKDVTDRLPSLASASINKILGFTQSLASILFNLLTIATLTVYFLLALPRMESAIENMFVGEARERNRQVFRDALEKVGGYVSGKFAVSLVAGTAAFVFLWLVGVPFAAPLGLWVALTDLIPSVGATLGAIVVVPVAFFDSVGHGVATLAFFLVYQQLENYVIGPRIMRKAVGLSPAAGILSALIGGTLAGFAGALLALPLAAAIKVVVRDVLLRRGVPVPGEAEAVTEGPEATPA
jgi:predicted PurR-regulated permease PerM